MIDTDDLDRTLRAAFGAAAEVDALAGDPAARVASRVARRRHRRVATRVAAAAVVVAIAAALVGVSITPRHATPAHPPAPKYPTPSALLRPQTAADRLPRSLGSPLLKGVEQASVRLLQSQAHARLYGARDVAGQFCTILMLEDGKNRPSWGSDCSDRSLGAPQEAGAARRFQLQGNALSSSAEGRLSNSAEGRWAVAFFLPDGITRVAIGSERLPVVRNSFLVVATHSIGLGSHETRIGSTLYIR